MSTIDITETDTAVREELRHLRHLRAAARERYRAGGESELVIDIMPEFGSGDADLARAISEDLDGRWDR